jgi:hypothetical protein
VQKEGYAANTLSSFRQWRRSAAAVAWGEIGGL